MVITFNLKEHICLVPPKEKRKASEIVTVEENDYPFSIDNDDNSDAEYVWSVINQ